jgi:hypothetical protein
MTDPAPRPDAIDRGPSPRRLFVHEPGWRVGQKIGSTREFCYMMAPGQDFYHRLLDGELFLYHGDERLCLACAERRGLLSYEAKALREVQVSIDVEIPLGGIETPPEEELRSRPENNGDTYR